jgi:DNA-binding transcriptional regulator YiaG
VQPAEVDVKRIRSQAKVSQAEFARAFCIQSRGKPDAAIRAYLAVIAKNCKVVLDALAS